MQRGIERLRRRIADVEAFDPMALGYSETTDPGLSALETSIADTLDKVFGHNTVERDRYEVGNFDSGPLTLGMPGRQRPDRRHYVQEGKARILASLSGAVASLQEELDERSVAAAPTLTPTAREAAPRSRRVFVVHGRALGPKADIARFLERIGLEPIILNEQPNQGRTVIEKIEAYGDVGFAVVLLTPDDEGALSGEALQPRARQNVIIELGYFIGRLGRRNVCTLKVGNLEIPTDWQGVVDEPFDEGGGWRVTLARELEAAEYNIDWNIVMGTKRSDD
jgi:predicted nucleotide-binding protein